MNIETEDKREKVAAMRECLRQLREIKKVQARYRRLRKELNIPKIAFLED